MAMSPRFRWIVLVSLVLVNLLVDAIGAFVLTERFLMILAGQTSLLALWAAWGTEAWVVRWPRACLIAVLQAEALCLGLRAQAPFYDVLFYYLFLECAAIILGTQALLTGIGWLWPLRIQLISGVEPLGAHDLPRLTIRRLLVWTAIIGALLAAGRMMVSSEWSILSSPDATRNPLASIIGMLNVTRLSAELAVFVIAAALPWMWATLARRRIWVWQAGAMLYLGLLILVESSIPSRFYPFNTLRGIVESNLTIAAVVVLNLLVVRACGYRLVRVGRRVTSSAKLTPFKRDHES